MLVGSALLSMFISITWFVFTQKQADRNVEEHTTEIKLLQQVKADKTEIQELKAENKIELDNMKERFGKMSNRIEDLDKRIDELEIEVAKLEK